MTKYPARKSLRHGVTALLLALASTASAQVNDKKYADYFLVGQFGEICTMCEAVVLCETAAAPTGHTAVPGTGSFTLYHLHTRSFWSQVSTIWEWFITNFDSRLVAAGHRRPVTVHVVTDGNWAPPLAAEAQVSLEPGRLTFSDGREIDRTNRRWRRSSPPAELGYCERLPLWDALDAIKAHDTGGRSP